MSNRWSEKISGYWSELTSDCWEQVDIPDDYDPRQISLGELLAIQKLQRCKTLFLVTLVMGAITYIPTWMSFHYDWVLASVPLRGFVLAIGAVIWMILNRIRVQYQVETFLKFLCFRLCNGRQIEDILFAILITPLLFVLLCFGMVFMALTLVSCCIPLILYSIAQLGKWYSCLVTSRAIRRRLYK